MKHTFLLKNNLIILSILASFLIHAQETRDPYKWPFSQNSIWNVPIGSDARYVHAEIQKSTAYGMTIDEDIIVTTPGEKLMKIYENYAGWDRNKNRCLVEGPLMFSAPIPYDFIVSPDTWDGRTPNSGLAVLMPDGRTIRQTQPFAHCTEGPNATSRYGKNTLDIYGEGYYGAHGGSGLSAIGGTLRLGELTPESGPIRHALKVNIYGKRNLYYDSATKGYRWPALRADGYAAGNYGSLRDNPVEALRMGALLALPASMNLDSLGFETQPAKILAKAFQDYGAYVVDDTAWDVYAIVTEWSPEGNFADEFIKNWGFSFTTGDKNSPWARDMDRIFLNLHVIDNNGPDSIGGGGEPRMPLAPDFLPAKTITLETDGTRNVKFTRSTEFTASSKTLTKIMVSQIPEGFHFKNWELIEGDAVIINPEEIETMVQVNDQDSRIRANFGINYYNITIDASGSGEIEIDPDQDTFVHGTVIKITALPENGWEFAEWQGDVSGNNNPVNLIISSEINATAVFQKITSVEDRIRDIKSEIEVLYNNSLHCLHIFLNNTGEKYTICIYSLDGKKVKEVKTRDGKVAVTVQELMQGTYIARIKKEKNMVKSFRFVKSN